MTVYSRGQGTEGPSELSNLSPLTSPTILPFRTKGLFTQNTACLHPGFLPMSWGRYISCLLSKEDSSGFVTNARDGLASGQRGSRKAGAQSTRPGSVLLPPKLAPAGTKQGSRPCTGSSTESAQCGATSINSAMTSGFSNISLKN
ncbi:hypothetical protein AOLI_G00057470 [Acnodon oligacanthus]